MFKKCGNCGKKSNMYIRIDISRGLDQNWCLACVYSAGKKLYNEPITTND